MFTKWNLSKDCFWRQNEWMILSGSKGDNMPWVCKSVIIRDEPESGHRTYNYITFLHRIDSSNLICMPKLDFLRDFVSQLSLFLLGNVNEWQRSRIRTITTKDEKKMKVEEISRRKIIAWRKFIKKHINNRITLTKKSKCDNIPLHINNVIWVSAKKILHVTFHAQVLCHIQSMTTNGQNVICSGLNDDAFMQVHINASLYRKLFVVKSRQTLKKQIFRYLQCHLTLCLETVLPLCVG